MEPKNGKGYKTQTPKERSARDRQLVTRAGQVAVFVITMASTVLSFVAFGVSWTTVVIAALSLVLLISLLANAVFLVDARNKKRGLKQIAFLTPSSGGQPFYAAMLTGLIHNASRALGQDYLLVPSMPTESFETVSIWSLFSSLEDRQLDIDGIIFIPDQPDQHFEELVGFHESRGDVPLVLVDVYFDLASCDDHTRSRLPSFVGGDELVGGSIAAEILVEAVGTPPTTPSVLVINGGIAPWEQQRAVAFRDRVKSAWPNVKFIESPPFNYSRPAALSYTFDLIQEIADPSKQVIIDAIFACNDDMAIGARAAIDRAIRVGYTFARQPQIVGYDGIEEIREYLDSGDPYIAGTVDVRIARQAEAAMMLIHKLVRTGQRRSEVHLVEPQPVRRRPARTSSDGMTSLSAVIPRPPNDPERAGRDVRVIGL